MKRVLAVVMALALSAACSGDDGPKVAVVDNDATTSTESTTTTEARNPSEAAMKYFEAFGSADLVKMEGMLENSVEGSPAGLYATLQVESARSFGSSVAQKLSLEDDIVTLCDTVEDVDDCTTYEDFQADPGGKLTTFTVQGVPLEQRIAPGGPEVVDHGIGVTLRVVYQNVAGRLMLLFDLRNGADSDFALLPSVYLTPEGRQVDMEYHDITGMVRAGATVTASMAFPAVDRGGTFVLEGAIDDFYTTVSISIPVP